MTGWDGEKEVAWVCWVAMTVDDRLVGLYDSNTRICVVVFGIMTRRCCPTRAGDDAVHKVQRLKLGGKLVFLCS